MSSEQRSWFHSRNGRVLLGFLAIAGFFLWEEHKAHLLEFCRTPCCYFARSCTCFMEDMEVTGAGTISIKIVVNRFIF